MGDEHWSGLMHFDRVSSKTFPRGHAGASRETERAMQNGAGSLQVNGQAEAHVLNTSPSLSHAGAAGGEGD